MSAGGIESKKKSPFYDTALSGARTDRRAFDTQEIARHYPVQTGTHPRVTAPVFYLLPFPPIRCTYMPTPVDRVHSL